MDSVKVISLGGSIIIPDKLDIPFLQEFYKEIVDYLTKHSEQKLIFVCGGGAIAREYQKAYAALVSPVEHAAQDWIGIAATRLNAELLRRLFHQYCQEDVVIDPSAVTSFQGRVLIAAGWKPGFSTDFDAVLLAEKFGARTVINLSNIKKVYSADPKTHPDAYPLDTISWADFRKITGGTWTPGANVPFDPVAADQATKSALRVIVAYGRDLTNLRAILEERAFNGTLIGE